MKAAWAVIAGFVVVALGSTAADALFEALGVLPSPMTTGAFVFAAVYRAIFTMLGGAVTARLGPQPPGRRVWVLAGLGVLGGGAGVAVSQAHPELGPAWYAWSILLTGPPSVLLGARLGRLPA